MRFILTAWSAERKGQNRKIGGADHARPGVGEIVLPALIDMDVSEVVLGNENSREGFFCSGEAAALWGWFVMSQ